MRINPSTFLCRAWSTTPGVIGVSLLCLFLAPLVSTAQNTISTYAGGTNFGTTATTIDLPGPSGVIRDGAGNTYIAAPYSTYVFKLTGNTISSFSGLVPCNHHLGLQLRRIRIVRRADCLRKHSRYSIAKVCSYRLFKRWGVACQHEEQLCKVGMWRLLWNS